MGAGAAAQQTELVKCRRLRWSRRPCIPLQFATHVCQQVRQVVGIQRRAEEKYARLREPCLHLLTARGSSHQENLRVAIQAQLVQHAPRRSEVIITAENNDARRYFLNLCSRHIAAEHVHGETVGLGSLGKRLDQRRFITENQGPGGRSFCGHGAAFLQKVRRGEDNMPCPAVSRSR